MPLIPPLPHAPHHRPNVHAHSALRHSGFCPVFCMAALSLSRLGVQMPGYPPLRPLRQILSIPSLFSLLRSRQQEAQCHFMLFFFRSTAYFPSFSCSKKEPRDSVLAKESWRNFVVVFLGMFSLLFKRTCLSAGLFFPDLDTGVKCDIWCSGSSHVTMRQQR